MDRTNRQLPTEARARGFTLIELLVVLGIIVLLASLVLAVSGSVIRASEERATRNTLEILNAATEEFERTLDRRVTYRHAATVNGITADPTTVGGISQRYDIDGAATVPVAGSGAANWNNLQVPYVSPGTNGLPAYSNLPARRTANLLWVMSQTEAVAPILQKLPDSVLRNIRFTTGVNYSPLRHCVDSWETPIIAIFPGREATQAEIEGSPNAVDKDGTIKSDSEWSNATAGGLRLSCKDRRILWVSAGNDTRFSETPANGYAPSADNLYSYEP
jgi:prepilin-type N-terminal cleavage/methylation domain-containing protein